ncbi:FUSC family protein [Curtobacterium sp. RRHDQ10]|uniref:FUSC family protein n=1 Tax=Curtobacterium phyllosphaerae TaxID=3413379 RepID=UPI003BF436E9
MTTTTAHDPTAHPRPPRLRTRTARLEDRVLMLDVGLAKTMVALRTLFAVPAGMGVGYLVARQVGLPGILGLLIGAMPAFISCLVVADATTRRVSARTAVLVVPFVAALSCSIALHRFRLLELALIVVVLFLQFAAAGWGRWANDAAIVLFSGYLLGLLTPLPETSVEGLALIVAGSLAATIVVRAVGFRPDPYRSLLRTRRAFLGWSSLVLRGAEDLLRTVPEGAGAETRAARRALRRLRRRTDRLQEVALTADGRLAADGSGRVGDAAAGLHRLLFDTHLAVDGIARSAETLVTTGAPADVRALVRQAVATVVEGGGVRGEDAARTLVARAAVTPSSSAVTSTTAHVVDRVALQLADLTDAGARWRRLRDDLPRDPDGVPFETPVVLTGGRPEGAVPVLDDTLATGGLRGPWKRVHITASLRTGLQAAVAVALVEPLALLLSGQRFYWGVIGAMIVLAGTNTTGDRIRKGLHRGLGTVLGGVVGIGLVDLLGTSHPAISIVLVVFALAIGMYGFGGVYSVWVTCLVIVLCQVYAWSGSFSDALIPLRLAENLLGAAVAILVSVLVFPVATGAMIRSAVRRQLAVARSFVLEAGGVGAGHGPSEPASASRPPADALRSRSRALDAATYQLDAVMKPMVRFPTGGGARSDARTRASLRAVAESARELAGASDPVGPVPEAVERGLADAAATLASSIDALSGAVTTRRGAPGHADDAWVRSSEQLDAVDALTSDAREHDWVRNRIVTLGRIDDALAMLAERAGLPVTGSVSAASAPTARARRAAARVERRLGSREG